MNTEEHKAKHLELHRSFDELMADFIRHNKDTYPSRSTLMDLAEWSHEQTMNPTEEK